MAGKVICCLKKILLRGGVIMSLAIVPSDVLTQLSAVFNTLWPLLAVGLGIMAVPLLVRTAKSVFR